MLDCVSISRVVVVSRTIRPTHRYDCGDDDDDAVAVVVSNRTTSQGRQCSRSRHGRGTRKNNGDDDDTGGDNCKDSTWNSVVVPFAPTVSFLDDIVSDQLTM